MELDITNRDFHGTFLITDSCGVPCNQGAFFSNMGSGKILSFQSNIIVIGFCEVEPIKSTLLSWPLRIHVTCKYRIVYDLGHKIYPICQCGPLL